MRALLASGNKAFGRFSGFVNGVRFPPRPAKMMAVNSCDPEDLAALGRLVDMVDEALETTS